MPVDPAIVGAFLSGVGAVIGSWWSLKHKSQELHKECDERMDALREGYRMGRHEEAE